MNDKTADDAKIISRVYCCMRLISSTPLPEYIMIRFESSPFSEQRYLFNTPRNRPRHIKITGGSDLDKSECRTQPSDAVFCLPYFSSDSLVLASNSSCARA